MKQCLQCPILVRSLGTASQESSPLCCISPRNKHLSMSVGIFCGWGCSIVNCHIGSRRPGASAHKISLKSCSFQAILREKTFFLSKFRPLGPQWGQNSTGPPWPKSWIRHWLSPSNNQPLPSVLLSEDSLFAKLTSSHPHGNHLPMQKQPNLLFIDF